MNDELDLDLSTEYEEPEEFIYRVFGRETKKISYGELQAFLEGNNIPLKAIEIVDEEDEDDHEADYEQLLLCDPEGNEVAMFVWDDLKTSDVLAEELDDFREMLDELKPAVNRPWLKKFFDEVTCCYALFITDNGFEAKNWEALAQLTNMLRLDIDGIEQSDSGPITNEDGSIILDFELEDEERDDTAWLPVTVALWEKDGWTTFAANEIDEYEDFLNAK